MTDKTNKKLLKITDIVETYNIPKSTIYYLIRQGRFPKQVKLSERSVAWRANEIAQWYDNLEKEARS